MPQCWPNSCAPLPWIQCKLHRQCPFELLHLRAPWIETVSRRHTRIDLVLQSVSTSASGSMIAERIKYSSFVLIKGPRSPRRGVKSKCSLISMSRARLTRACFSCAAVLTTVMFEEPRISPPPSNAGTGLGADAGAACAIVTGAVPRASTRACASEGQSG